MGRLLLVAIVWTVADGTANDVIPINGNPHRHLRHHPTSKSVVDNFNCGSSPFNPSIALGESNYFYFSNPEPLLYVGNDADIVQNANSITQTAEPYQNTMEQGSAGSLDHIKTLQYRFPAFVPGSEKGIIEYEMRLSGSVTLPETLPFESSLITNADDDLRLAGIGMNTLDFETFIVANFFLTNTGIWVMNERNPIGWTTDNMYKAYIQVKRVADRASPTEEHTLRIVYNQIQGTIAWYVENTIVLSTNSIGIPIDTTTDPDVVTILDHGGTVPTEPVIPNSLFAGWGQFSLLDASDPNNADSSQGLVQLSNFYIHPSSFADEVSLESSRLFGQGATMTVDKFKVQTK